VKISFTIATSWIAATRVGILTLGAAISADAQGIPEPSFIFYGLVRNAADNNLILHHGSLAWTNRMLSTGRIVTRSVPLGNYGGFSYVLEVPAETLISGSAVSSNVLQLTAGTNQFDWFPVIYDSGVVRTQAAFAVPAQGSFLASSRQRGRIERVDLVVGIRCRDEDGNGLCDDWEDFYFQTIGLYGPNDDPDGDGLTNAQEYRAGSDPTDPNSGLLFVRYEAMSPTSMQLEWQSAEGRAYGLYRSTNLLSVFTTNLSVAPDSKLIATNMFATPPLNVFVDTNVVPPGPYFYRLRLE
jgi:hypothetical protein